MAFVNVGTVLAYFLMRKTDHLGRKFLLTVTIVGYTLFTFATAFSPNVYVFAVLQMIARIFLIAEWSTSTIIAAEEFPAERRGEVIGYILGASALGAITCSIVVPGLLRTPWGWRTVYLVGVLPLLLIAFARRGLEETSRFRAVEASLEARPSFFRIWRTPYRGRMLALAAVWFTAFIPTTVAVSFWKKFAMDSRGYDDVTVGKAMALAAVVSIPLLFISGRVSDLIGRRRALALVLVVGAAGYYGAYTFHGFWPLTGSLILGMFGVGAYLPMLNAYTSELFPTEFRGDAFGWANHVLGRISYVLAPLVVGFAGQAVGGFGPVISSLAILPLVTLALVYMLLPETNGLELEQTSAVDFH
jgi:putative MFS transporter